MKAIFLSLGALLIFAPLATAQEPEADATMPPMGRPAEMDAIAYFLGEWNVDMEFKMDPTSDEWVQETGTAVVTPILDGCVNHMEYTGEFMGMPFHGFDNTTWDREYQRYESVWTDNMSARMSVSTGNFEGDRLVMGGPDKMQGQEFLNRTVAVKKSDDEIYWTMEMSVDNGETWIEHMRMTYTRKK